ncbi:polysaccharide deacetylase family protein [Marinobacter fuscus]|uniref:polysaccharide deacetylase family protein n=1 Tax=Marinobacter fuscus TaxID=2109942 RepID=UPI001F0C1A5D|nr:polysaccharide deacetylase family protein [Marinobacter fuscus]
MATIRSLIKFWALNAFALYGWLRLRAVHSPTLLILTYHRVLPTDSAERPFEQPGMIISPENLEQHIKIIQSIGAVPIHLDEWLSRKKAGKSLPTLAVAFTFDDGWRDNYLNAFPILKQQEVPATIFLVTKLVDTSETFWPEQVIRVLRTPGVDRNHPALEWLKPHLGELAHKPWPMTLLEADQVINNLKDLDDATIQRHLATSAKVLAEKISGETDNTPAILQSRDIAEMAENDLVRYGAHTRNHYRLNRLNDMAALEQQITGCVSDLREITANSTAIFCYPNGDITDKGKQLVADSYHAACTTKAGWNTLTRSKYDLHRINLHDGNSSSPRTLLATIGRTLA